MGSTEGIINKSYKRQLEYFLSYKLSQNHLEMFFPIFAHEVDLQITLPPFSFNQLIRNF
jgi:hypothetical protein